MRFDALSLPRLRRPSRRPRAARAFAALALAGSATVAAAAEPATSASPTQERRPDMAASKASTPAKARPAASRKGRIDADQLTGLFPGSLGDWHLLTLAKPLPSPVPGPRPAVEAEYGKGNDEAQLSISNDLPSAA